MSNINNREDRMAFLANSIAKSKKVMDKVESKSFSGGHIDREAMFNAPNPVNKLGESYVPVPYQNDEDATEDEGQDYNPYNGQPNTNAERNLATSKMPSAILESFAKNPISSNNFKAVNTSNPLAPNSSQMADLANKVPGPKRQPQQQQFQQQQYAPQQQFQQQYAPQPQATAQPLSEDYIKFIINKTIEETVEKTVVIMLEQLNKPSTIDENIQIKIGSKTFGGKINTLKG